MARRRPRARGNVRRVRNKLQGYVRLFAGKGGLWTRVYPADTPRETIQQDIDKAVKDYKDRKPNAERGTLAADIVAYLKLFAHRPKRQAELGRYLQWWADQFGKRARWSLKAPELEAALSARMADGFSASDAKHHRSALFNLYIRLDGKDERNPVRDVPAPREPEPMPRALPFDLIERIFDHIPVQRHSRGLTDEQRDEARSTQESASSMARRFGCTEAAIRKARAAKPHTDALAQTRARLQVMAHLGLPPAQIRLLTPSDIDWTGGSVLVHGRRKGGGTKPVRRPLTPKGVAALRALSDAGAWGDYSTSSARRVWIGAIDRMCTALERDQATEATGRALREQLKTATPYTLRHSFLTALQLAGKNIRATQAAAQHVDGRMTERYLLAAVDPELQAATDALAATQAVQHPVQHPDAKLTKIDLKRPNPTRAPKRQRTAKTSRNARK